MRRSHVFDRSARRPGAFQEPANRTVVARTIAAQLGNMIDKVAGADLRPLLDLLEAARIEAERIVVSEGAE